MSRIALIQVSYDVPCESLLQGIPGVVVYIDDILITGATEQDHLRALEEIHRAQQTTSVHGHGETLPCMALVLQCLYTTRLASSM